MTTNTIKFNPEIKIGFYSKGLPQLGLSRPDWSPTTRPNRPTPTRFRPKPKSSQSMTGFRFQEPTLVGEVVGLLLQNPRNPNPTGAI